MWKGVIVGVAALLSAGCLATHHPEGMASTRHWVESFQLSPSDGKPTAALLQKYPGLANLPIVAGTVRYRFALSVGGERLRVQLFNPTDTPLHIAASSVARGGTEMDALPESIRPLTFAGQTTVIVPVNAGVLSDPVDLKSDALAEMIVSLFIPEGYPSSPLGGASMSWSTENAVMSATLNAPKRVMGRPFVNAVLVAREREARVIVAFGDSITDGARSKPAEPHGWADALARRLAQEKGGLGIGVVSAGISGNRVLSPGWGPSASARIDRDVLAVPGVHDVIVLEGINDIGNADEPAVPADIAPLDADRLIAGLAQIGVRARARGLKAYVGTLPPFRGAKYFSEDKEKIRLAVNAWIRRSADFDGVIDFEKAVQNPAQPDSLNPPFDSGDHLHPSEAGYRAMAAAIPLELFR